MPSSPDYLVRRLRLRHLELLVDDGIHACGIRQLDHRAHLRAEHTEADGIRLILNPKTIGGAETVRNRLIRKLGSIASVAGDDVVVTILN